ncbi:MAG TPA: orotate phosphoribosyltransferase [Candidatus Binatia bacterium]|nr:orotate phosphoribosyltransferase [Candidatus Binatia bacterium]
MEKALEELRTLLEHRSLQRGDFILASGARSKFYFNSKTTLLSPHGARLTGEILYERFAALGVEAVGGLAMGATYIAAAVALVSDLRGRPIYGFTVREKKKEHGLCQSVDESFHPDGRPLLVPGRRVAVVDDVVTKGGSIQKAIDAVRERQCDIVAVIALVDRDEGGRDVLRASGLPYSALFVTDREGRLHVDYGAQVATPVAAQGALR